MNLEQYPQFVAAVNERFDHHVVDGKTYVSIDDVNHLLDFISTILLQEAKENGMCQHAHEVASFIISNMAAVTDTLIGIHAEELVSGLKPEDFLDED